MVKPTRAVARGLVFCAAWVDEAGGGRLDFREDLYGHDTRQRALLGLDQPRSARVAPANRFAISH